ncbi:GNAT family N-acetyltransferase [Mesorhizobium silamurunense]|uniref:GNAT family N-acetyltransferase n=1 Tax=Mesorhizobium silamurunense TaxID=499528 RepID=UPI0017803C39|nr:GNAT family N-acetyltransferase [Mesorhizobium silamurunense]
MSETTVLPLEQFDQAEWRRLWNAYLDQTKLPEEVCQLTWKRLSKPGEFEPSGWLAVLDGKPVGLVHAVLHRTCWAEKNSCYLQDLYVDPELRGQGVGRALIEQVYRYADEIGADSVYWYTHETNTTARRLYDRIGKRSGFIQYSR